VEVPQNFILRTLLLPLKELQTEHEIVYGMAIVLTAEGDIPAVYSDVSVPVSGARVRIQPRLVSKTRSPSILYPPLPCVVIAPALPDGTPVPGTGC